MLKNTFLVLSICILFLGCKNSRKIAEYSIDSEKTEVIVENSEYSIDKDEYKFFEIGTILTRLEDYGYYYKTYNYQEDNKSFSVKYEEDIIFLNNFTSDELSGYIETITFGPSYETTILPSITSLSNLKYLNLPDFKNISSIPNFTNLEFLHFNFYEDIEGFDSIFDLINLKKLWIRGPYTHLMDLTHIGKLQNLEELFINGITQEGLNNLANLKKLKYLEIFGMDIKDISPLLNLPNLERVNLSSSHYYSDITPLASSKSLIEIILSFGSEEEYIKFMNNEGKIFGENGISIPPRDWR
jgi:hypothetical protein